MKPKTVSLALAAGLFLLALWLAFRPHGVPTGSGPVGERKEDVSRTPAEVVAIPARVVAVLPSATLANAGIGGDKPTPVAGAMIPSVAVSATPGDTEAADRGATKKTDSAPRDAEVDVVKVRVMMHDYHNLMGENPVGTNAEIMKALMGGNTRTATLGPPEGMTLNGAGELVDQWNTPYFFHQLSKDVMEIRSAGPDKVMWTADDVVTR